MKKYVLKRILLIIPTLAAVACVIFTIMYFVPGDPAALILGREATEAQLAAKRAEMGIDKPFLAQLFVFLKNIFLNFDFGKSYVTGIPIIRELGNRLPYTLIIGIGSLLMAMLIGVPLGITAAVHQDGLADRICMVLALMGVSMPQFWLGILLVILFTLRLGWLPASGIGTAAHYVLPIVASCVGALAMQARQSRSAMLEVIRSDYVNTARSKGVSWRKIIYKHALPNAMLPILTVAGNNLALCFGGSVVIESVFSIPGVGTYMISGVNNRDYPIVLGCVVILAFIFTVVMLLLDLSYAFVDPLIKARYQTSGRK
jgi:peptide/nickel transport system permease protein